MSNYLETYAQITEEILVLTSLKPEAFYEKEELYHQLSSKQSELIPLLEKPQNEEERKLADKILQDSKEIGLNLNTLQSFNREKIQLLNKKKHMEPQYMNYGMNVVPQNSYFCDKKR